MPGLSFLRCISANILICARFVAVSLIRLAVPGLLELPNLFTLSDSARFPCWLNVFGLALVAFAVGRDTSRADSGVVLV